MLLRKLDLLLKKKLSNPIKYIKKDVIVNNVYMRNVNSTSKYIVNLGGAGSSKSYSLCQMFLFNELLKRKKYKVLILRKSRHSLKLSTYQTFINMLKDYDIYKQKNHNQTDLSYEFPESGNIVQFSGMDNREKIKSTEWHDIWMEESNEFNFEDFVFLQTRLYRGRTDGHKPRIIMSLNPVECWVKRLEKQWGIEFIHSTYKDNKFINADYVQTLESLKEQDLSYYMIYAEGKWAQLTDLVFIHFKHIPISEYPEHFDEIIFGVDWGYVHPAVLLMVGIKENKCYVRELLYQSYFNRPDLISMINTKIKEVCGEYFGVNYNHYAVSIYPDSEDPESINALQQAGFKCTFPADKRSVLEGIKSVKVREIYTNDLNVNFNNESKLYKWRKDRNGNIIEDPVKFKDDAMAALRYAVHTHFGKIMSSTGQSDSLLDMIDLYKRDSNDANLSEIMQELKV